MASPELGHIAGGREGLVSVCRGGGLAIQGYFSQTEYHFNHHDNYGRFLN